MIHRTQAMLARALGVDPSAIRQWIAKHTDHPADFDDEKWRAFMAAHELGIAPNRIAKGRDALLKDKLKTEIRLNGIKIAKEERKLIPADEVRDFHTFMFQRFKSGLYQTFESELPPKTAGADVSTVRKFNTEAVEMLLGTFQAAVKEWDEQQEAAAEAAAHATRAAEADSDE